MNSLLDCPLNALGREDVMTRLKVERGKECRGKAAYRYSFHSQAKIDHAVSLRAFKLASDTGVPMDTSPMTRRPVLGGLCLGVGEEHCRATTWALDQAITGGKRVGNADLWFAVIWQLVELGHTPWLSQPVVEAIRRQMTWRLAHHSTFIALTGDPGLPTTRVTLATAVW